MSLPSNSSPKCPSNSSPKLPMDCSWYDSATIEEYMSILVGQKDNIHYLCTSFATQFTTRGIPGVRRWIKVNLFSKDVILFTTHVNKNHWILIGVDIRKKSVFQHDSLGDYYPDSNNLVVNFMKSWEKECGRPPSSWKTEKRQTPPQRNTYDCGPWILHVAKCISFNIDINFMTK